MPTKKKFTRVPRIINSLSRYGHIGTLTRGGGMGGGMGGMGPQTGFINPGHGTLGRPPKPTMHQA